MCNSQTSTNPTSASRASVIFVTKSLGLYTYILLYPIFYPNHTPDPFTTITTALTFQELNCISSIF